MRDLQRVGFLGHLDQDTDPSYIQQGNYTDALNVRPLTDNTESSQSIVNIKGNLYTVSIGTISPQIKYYAVFVSSATTTSNQLTFKDQNGNLLGIATFAINAGTLSQANNYPTINATILAALGGGLNVSVILSTTNNIDGKLIINVRSTGTDYTITSTGVNTLSISVIQEAYDTSLSGNMQVIGSYDYLGDLFVWSTSQTNLPSFITPVITSMTNVVNSLVTTSSPHGLNIGQLISITGVVPVAYNGLWIVSGTPSSTTFNIKNTSALGVYVSGGIIEINVQGIGEVGVIQYNADADIYSYTRLIRSKQFNFVTKHQVDTYIEANSFEKSIYWTDDYNPPRVLYYKGDYIQDGAITFYNPNGIYSYDTINNETKLFLSALDVTLLFDSQTQLGGAVLSGNWRYSIQFLTDNNTSTDLIELSNPIPVFKSDTGGTPSQMSGDDANVTTTKINNLLVTGIIPGLFKYIQLIGVNYVNGSTIGYILSKTLLDNISTSVMISHTGLETNVQNLDLGTLNEVTQIYDTAKNITVVDNRMILSNLTSSQQKDFSSIISNWTHTIVRQTLAGVGTDDNPNVLRVAEYNDPSNVFYFTGYMLNETYRFGARLRLKNGSLTDVFWIDDIRFDTSATNVTTPNRRIGAVLPTYDLTDNGVTNNNIYTFGVNINGIDVNKTINGVPFKDLVDEIIFERSECVKEILFSGVAVLSVDSGVFGALTDGAGVQYNGTPPGDSVNPVRRGEYTFIAGDGNGNPVPQGGTYPNAGGGGVAIRSIVCLYSPDHLFGQTDLAGFNNANGDVMLNFGQVKLMKGTGHSTSDHYNGSYMQYTGYTNVSTFQNAAGLPPAITEAHDTTLGQEGISLDGGATLYSKVLKTFGGNIATWAQLGSPVIRFVNGSFLSNWAANTDYGLYQVQYKRPIDLTIPYSNPDTQSKYGTRGLTKYVPTGTKLTVTSTVNNQTYIFGGDVFNQKTYLKWRFANSSTSYGIDGLGGSAGFSFYSQNRVNTQLNRRYNNTYFTWDFPRISPSDWLTENSTVAISYSNVVYNKGYNPTNLINSAIGFDVNAVQLTEFPQRIIYSDLKLQGGIVDNYRKYLPLNFKDLDAGFGEIIHTANGNGELITWQPRKFQRQYFNTRGILQSSSNLNVLIGDGTVLSRDGQTLSTIGTKHKWSVIKGKSAQGNDTFYWINTELKKAPRFGYDGTISLADIKGMQSFLANNLTWVDNVDTPADGKGICGVWDDRFMEVLWSVRGKRNIVLWSSATNYVIGNTVSYIPANFSTFEQTGEIYIALTNNVNKNPSTFPSDWKLISHKDNNYYNEYNLVYNEMRNGFTAFYSFLPKIFLKWKDNFFTPRPIQDYSRIYIHNKGVETTWYDDGITSQIVDGYIEGVVNAQPDTVKWFEAIRTNSEISPERFDFKTKTQVSFLTSTEITSREGNFDSPIKMDSTGQIVNDAQTSRLYGKFMKGKMTFKSGIYQKLFDYIVKFRNSVRLPNK